MGRAQLKHGFALLLCVLLLSGCVTKGTHRVALNDLASARADAETLQSSLTQAETDIDALRDELASERRALEAERQRLQGDIRLLEEDLARMDMQRAEARSEADQLQTALRQRGGEYRALEARLASLSAIEQEIRDRNRIYEEVIGRFQSLIDGGQLSVSIARGRLVIQLPQDILFESGSANVGRDGQTTLAEVGAVLAELSDRKFQIEGHTDNVPIATQRFPSNWELSSGRALSVVRLLVAAGVTPENLSGAGYGEFQPVADNDDRESRQLNRRIEIVMLPNLDLIAQSQLPG